MRTTSASASAGNAHAATSARSARVWLRTSAIPSASAGITARTPKWRKASAAPVPSFHHDRPLKAGRGERANGRRKNAAGRSVARLRMNAGLKSRSARLPAPRTRRRGGKVPRVRRDDGREEEAVEQGSRNASDAAREAEKRHEKRERDGVRMEIPEPEREERPLGDRVRVIDAPRGQPPVEVDERLSREELPGPVERPAEDEKQPAEDREARAAPPRADRAEARERREGRQERGDEVVGVLRRHARGARGKREEVRPEVIVGKALAGEPRIGERQARTSS